MALDLNAQNLCLSTEHFFGYCYELMRASGIDRDNDLKITALVHLLQSLVTYQSHYVVKLHNRENEAPVMPVSETASNCSTSRHNCKYCT